MYKVSIIIPAYNSEKTLKRSLDTLINQKYKEIEIIIVNDGSNDNTEVVAKSIAKDDLRIRVISIKNGGVSNARNIGIENAKGEFIAFMDSDDFMDLDMISQLMSNFDNKVDLVCCGHKVVNDRGKVTFFQEPFNMRSEKKEYYKAIENMKDVNCFNSVWNKIFRKSVIINNNIKMDTSLSMGEDYLFVMEYLKKCTNDIVVISKPLYNYTLSSGGLQASFESNEQLRLEQLKYLKNLYLIYKYPLNGFYYEVLRTFYILILEAKSLTKVINKIFMSDEYKQLVQEKLEFSVKYSVFLMLLKMKNKIMIIVTVKLFRGMKILKGRAYKW
ncbi:MAG: glycosyltransferase family 2 protein [Clostridium sp.]|nr:glycosyltransferase family 2 protein [Clostridium sp.]